MYMEKDIENQCEFITVDIGHPGLSTTSQSKQSVSTETSKIQGYLSGIKAGIHWTASKLRAVARPK